MQMRANQQGQEGPAAESADRSTRARARQVRNLRQENEASGSSAANGADNSTSTDSIAFAQIPKHLLSRFKRIPDSDGGIHPAYVSMTRSEQDFVGENMGLEMEMWQHLVKTPVLALPQTAYCKYWMDWAVATRQLPYGTGCMLMHPDAYESSVKTPGEALTHHGPHNADQQDFHIKACGYPMAVWRWIVSPDYDGDTLDDGFELIEPSTNQNTAAAER
jgi:hypothetical protein